MMAWCISWQLCIVLHPFQLATQKPNCFPFSSLTMQNLSWPQPFHTSCVLSMAWFTPSLVSHLTPALLCFSLQASGKRCFPQTGPLTALTKEDYLWFSIALVYFYVNAYHENYLIIYQFAFFFVCIPHEKLSQVRTGIGSCLDTM